MSSFFDDSKDEKENSQIGNDEHGLNGVFLVGTTKAGKSSHVKLLTGQNVKIPNRDDAESCTKVISSYMCQDSIKKEFGLNDKNSLFIDTPGLQDSDNLTDDEIFHQIGLSLSKMRIENIKILWLVLPQEAACQGLQTEATFITKLGQNNANIWKSVIIICKKPNGNDPLKRSIQGPIAAAVRSIKKLNDNNNSIIEGDLSDISDYLLKNACGYQCIEWSDMSEESMKEKAAKYATSAGDAKFLQKYCLLYSENDIRKLLFNKILKLSFYRIMFYDKKCIKCGINCDPRFPPDDSKCHGNMEEVHESQGEWKHTGHSRNKEIGSKVKWEHGPTDRCPKCIGSVDSMRYHTESWVSTWTCHSCGNLIKVGSRYYHCNDCCDRSNHKTNHVYTCYGMFCATCVEDKCNKCHQYPNSSRGCIPREVTIYGNRYTCCDRDVPSIGCKIHYPCCGHTGDNKKPCRKQCAYCKTKWGQSPGCVGNEHKFEG